jgi:hypothetical protein
LTAFTTSGDGTSHKKTQYKSTCIMMKVPDYNCAGGSPQVQKNQFVAMQTATSHTSEAQVQGFDDVIRDILHTEAQHGCGNPGDISSIYMKLKGTNSDHAEDQKKWA